MQPIVYLDKYNDQWIVSMHGDEIAFVDREFALEVARELIEYPERFEEMLEDENYFECSCPVEGGECPACSRDRERNYMVSELNVAVELLNARIG